MELNLRFPEINQVIIKLDEQETERLPFTSPVSAEDQENIRWYLETYATHYTTNVDDARAKQIGDKLPQWGEDLFNAVFQPRTAQRIFNDFQDEAEPGRLLTISASHPTILSLPWELLRDPEGTYLCHENPRISIRRRLAGAGGGRRPFKVKVKDCLRLLFVISRPSDARFIDPRGEAQAVLDAIAQEAAGRVEVEFLRPATLDNLVARLEDSRKPPVDIVHFDGHGVFDVDGRLHERAKFSDTRSVKPPAYRLAATKGDHENNGNTGYLLFEDKQGKTALITAETLGDMLNRQKVGLIVLSACQSAKVDGEDAMGSVAARLTHAGIPAVLAMTHSVLVTTAQQLFAKFYQGLVSGEGMGEALDNARRDLYLNRERGERQRGEERITLKLQDWFLPALYQAGGDTPLLQKDLTPLTPLPYEGRGENVSPLLVGEGRGENVSPPLAGEGQGERSNWGNLPPLQEAGFFGRSRELWQIERWFVQGTRRLTVSGFGGQGKTYLVQEAGRWLHRTGMFEKVCFVDYAAFQGVDAVGLAVSTLATVLEKNLIDAAAATQALRNQPTLLILDNLESLSPEPLQELLTVAKQWSEVGECRVLITTRTPDFTHPDYPTEGSRKHISLPLGGLRREDALAYFQSLIKLPPAPKVDPPKREVLLELFKLVNFHPLSIGLLARQLKMRRPAELGQRLEALIAQTPGNFLLASLNLSLEKLDAEAMQLLPRLGVFQGGALEYILLEITEFSESQWQKLRPALEATGLIQPEHLPGVNVPYLKFHPTLAPTLWSRLSSEIQTELLARHRWRYYLLSLLLYKEEEDRKNPHFARAIAQQELPNLLYAVHGALDAGEEWAVEFVAKVNRFLDYFGLNRDRTLLTQRLAQLTVEVGSQTWYFSRTSLGEQLYNVRRYQEAARVFGEILAGLGEQPSYNHCATLGRLGRCLDKQGQTSQAAQLYRQGLAEAQQLEQSDHVKQLMGILQGDLANALTHMGDYGEARIAYEASLTIKKELGDFRGAAVSNVQLGTLALLQGNLPEAIQRYHEALTTFQQLHEPATEAVFWHQLGRVYEKAKQWDAAENAYRHAAQIEESQGNLAGAAMTWHQLALVHDYAGKAEEAEAWYRKAIQGAKATEDKLGVSKRLSNLANLLQNQPHRLTEARQLAEQALAIRKTLDPAAGKIWNIYQILAEIADKQGDTTQARKYRRLSRQAKAAFAGTQYELQEFGQFIADVVASVDDAEARKQLEAAMENFAEGSYLMAAIHRILDGERDQEVLCEPLNGTEAAIINAILQGIADPQTLEALLE
ncbi:tetratricopeptide repeat protein [Tolypothrix campylonemoides VB511288]|nr:tetratricopeptide repeat protein [Tolypothrix campylonemoides VB511288]